MLIRRLTGLEPITVRQKPASAPLCSSHTPQKPATRPQSVVRETRPRPRRIPLICFHSCGICPRSTNSTRFMYLKVTERIAQYFSLTDKLPGTKKGFLRARQRRDFPIPDFLLYISGYASFIVSNSWVQFFLFWFIFTFYIVWLLQNSFVMQLKYYSSQSFWKSIILTLDFISCFSSTKAILKQFLKGDILYSLRKGS